jgi:hypothetical protein
MDIGILKPCGVITCGWDCACGDPEASSCSCFYGIGGPLVAPSLPGASRRRGAHRARVSSRGRAAPAREITVPTSRHREAYDPTALASAAAQWLRQRDAEARSAPVFLALADEVRVAGGDEDLACALEQMSQDETRHALLCEQVASTLGAQIRPTRVDSYVAMAPHADVSLREGALWNVLYATCLSETIATALLVDALEHTLEPFLRAARRAILSDEISHAGIGFKLLRRSRAWLTEEPLVLTRLERFLTHALATLEKEIPCSMEPSRPLSRDERALGVLDPERGRAIFYETIEHAILPALSSLGIPARRAWARRRAVGGASSPCSATVSEGPRRRA